MSSLQHWMAHPEFRPFLAAAPQTGRILRPLCRLLGIEASPDVPAELNLPNPPPFRPAPPPPPPCFRIIDPPDYPDIPNRGPFNLFAPGTTRRFLTP